MRKMFSFFASYFYELFNLHIFSGFLGRMMMLSHLKRKKSEGNKTNEGAKTSGKKVS